MSSTNRGFVVHDEFVHDVRVSAASAALPFAVAEDTKLCSRDPVRRTY
jgi:hypothetical protein